MAAISQEWIQLAIWQVMSMHLNHFNSDKYRLAFALILSNNRMKK